jgi:hypothetical protein
VVVDARTQAAIAGATVRLLSVSGDAAAATVPVARLEPRATTDGRGEFTVPAVAPGRYRLVAELEGFLPFEHPVHITVEPGQPSAPVVVACTLRMTTAIEASAQAPDGTASTVLATGPVLSGDAIAAMPGGLEDVMRAFQSRAGVAATEDDRNDLIVRGGGAIENAVRLDGFDVPNASHFWAQGGSGGGLSFVAPWVIGRAVLATGGFSVEYGERASSVLDVTLKPSAVERVHGQVGASVGGFMAQGEGRLAKGAGSWMVSARRSFLELVAERNGDRVVPRYSDLIARVDYTVSGRHRIEWLALGAVDDARVEGAGSGAISDSQTVGLVGTSLRSQWSPRWTSGMFVSYGRSRIDAVVNGRTRVDGSDRSTEVEWRVRGELRRTLGADGAVMLGAAAKRAQLDFDLHAHAFRNDYNVVVPPLNATFPYNLTDGAAYGEARLPSTGRLQVTPAIRLDRAGTTGHVSWSPRINAELRVTDAIRARAAWGIYRQSIPYVWIGSDVRNAQLDPVRSAQAVVDVLARLPARIVATVSVFDKRYQGYPVDIAMPWRPLVSAAADYDSPFVGRLSDAGRVRARGLDATAARRIAHGVSVAGSYSLWRAEQSGIPAVGYGGWQRGDYDIRHQVRLDLTYAAGKWSASAQFRYASGRPYTPFDTPLSIKNGYGYYDRTKLNAATYPAYHRLDVRVERRVAIGRTALAVYGEIDNVYARDNVLFYQWVRATRQTKAVYQWGLQPIAGIRWMF